MRLVRQPAPMAHHRERSEQSPSHASSTRVTGLIGRDETIDRPGRANDEEPIDVGKRGERPGIAWVDAAAIKNRNLAAGLAEQVLAAIPDLVRNWFDVLGAGRSAPGADRPDWLIGDLNQSQ